MSNPLKPSATLLIKLGSVIVHQEEMMSANGHHFDKAALDTVREDPEVIEWLRQMTDLGMLPVKRDISGSDPSEKNGQERWPVKKSQRK